MIWARNTFLSLWLAEVTAASFAALSLLLDPYPIREMGIGTSSYLCWQLGLQSQLGKYCDNLDKFWCIYMPRKIIHGGEYNVPRLCLRTK